MRIFYEITKVVVEKSERLGLSHVEISRVNGWISNEWISIAGVVA